MAKAAAKKVVKKGKYFQNFSLLTHPLKIKPVGSLRPGHHLPSHVVSGLSA